jgi:DUF4097 and DUF4098 domain-containing protein YvlB
MIKLMNKTTFTVGLLLMLMAVPALGATVNKSIKIAAGEESSGASSVNGSISVGENAVVSGNLKTVNGTIRVDDGATIEKASTVNGTVRIGENVKSESLGTVNGSIRVARGSTVDGEIEAVNGRISLANETSVADNIANVNGDMDLSGATVGGDVKTVNGDIELSEGSVVKGNLIVEEPSSWGWGKSSKSKPRVVIGPGSRVEGDLILEREVELFISEDATVGGVKGKMSLDDAVRFSGKRP